MIQRNTYGVVSIVFFILAFLLLLSTFLPAEGATNQRELNPLRDIREPFIQSLIIEQQDTWDSREIKFISLRSSKGSVLLSGDKDLELIQFLVKNNHKKIILTVE